MKLERGINLGGYLSQCCHEEEHYDTFIVESDIKQISEWGFDHVRLAIDYEVFEEEDGTRKIEGFERVKRVIEWSKKYNLNIVLDLHKAYGYDFNDAGDADKNNLFASEDLQNRFIKLWIEIVQNYSSYDNVAFELLNEVVEEENADAWNKLIDKSVTAIREYAPTAPIIYGGIQWNSVNTLKLLELPKDENIIFTFHFYEPLVFTHQKAYWVKNMDMERSVNYPGTMEYYKEISNQLGYQGQAAALAKTKTMGIEFITEMIEEAIRVSKERKVKLYCGEFGVIDQAPIEDTLKWFKDVNEVFLKYNIGGAIWSYKLMDFGLIDDHYAPIKDELIKLWCQI
ncbi:MAG: glycoside hydrolase family 5 protein [Lachnospiraceae bacterium]|nr:glycoside hydrolase family 5 protein [Lachnospiraceae bacterium]